MVLFLNSVWLDFLRSMMRWLFSNLSLENLDVSGRRERLFLHLNKQSIYFKITLCESEAISYFCSLRLIDSIRLYSIENATWPILDFLRYL